MKYNSYFLFMLFSFISLKSEPQVNEQEELRKFASQLIESFDPEGKMSEQEKLQLVDKTVQETIQMDNYLKSLPEAERLAEEKKIEDAVSYLSSQESPIKYLFDQEQTPPASVEEPAREITEEQISEPIVTPVTPIVDVKDIKIVLESIVARISSLLVKTKSMPRVSQDKEVEKQWLKLRSALTLSESILKIVLKKDELLSELKDDKNKTLRNNLINLKNALQKETKFIVPDTAGLTISFDDEDEENVEFLTAQKNLRAIIDSLEKVISNMQLINQLINFIKTNASSELQKNPEIEKNIKDFQANHPNYSSGHFDGGYRPGSGYYPPSSPGFSGLDYPIYSDEFRPSGQQMNPFEQKTDSKPEGKKGSSEQKATKDSKKSPKDKDKTKKPKDSNKKDKEKSKKNPALDKYLEDLGLSLKDLAKSYKDSNISSMQEEIKARQEDPSRAVSDDELILQNRNFATSLTNIQRSYDKTNKIAYNFKAALNINKDNKEYYKEAKNIYHKSNISEQFKLLNEYKENLGKTGFPEASPKLIEDLKEIEKRQKELKDLLEIDKCEIKDDVVEFKSSIDNINKSINDLLIKKSADSDAIKSVDEIIVNYNLAQKSLKCIKKDIESNKDLKLQFNKIKTEIQDNLNLQLKALDKFNERTSTNLKDAINKLINRHKELLNELISF